MNKTKDAKGKNGMKWFLVIVFLLFANINYAIENPRGLSINETVYIVENKELKVEINNVGHIVRVFDLVKNTSFNVQEFTSIEGLFVKNVAIKTVTPSGVEINLALSDSLGDRACTIKKTLLPSTNSIRINVEIEGMKYDWSLPINTSFNFSEEKDLKFWTAWALGDEAAEVYNLDGELSKTQQGNSKHVWHDPLVPQPFTEMELVYGSKKSERYSKGFSLPLATVIVPGKTRSINVVFSPKDTLVNLSLKTQKNGELVFSRQNHRIGPNNIVSFSYDLFVRDASWRPVLAWITNEYPTFFNPPLERTHEIAGCSSYSGYNGDMDIEKMKHIAYGFNWFASRSWPYLGMFIPPVEDGQEWMSWSGFGSGTATTGKIMSYEKIRNDYKLMHERGFNMLAYFNLTEFGYQIKFPLENLSQQEKSKSDWEDSNVYLAKRLQPAILYTENNRVRYSWNKSVIMDPGHETYKNYLLEQAQRHIDKIPEFDGICIDRLDWFEWCNYRRDDGISMVDGKKVAAMSQSLHQIMEPLSSLMHKNGKVIYYNPHITRLDFAQYFDGIFDEFADNGDKINLTSLLALKKPIVGWIHSEDVLREAPDEIIQRFLYLGVFPMAPFPEANHSLVASEWANSLYQDYGLMFQALKGKEWILEHDVVEVEGNSAKVNIFKTNQGIIVPVMLGNDLEEAKIKIQSLNKLFPDGKYACFIVHPGDKKWRKFKVEQGKNDLNIALPLKRGCVMLLLK